MVSRELYRRLLDAPAYFVPLVNQAASMTLHSGPSLFQGFTLNTGGAPLIFDLLDGTDDNGLLAGSFREPANAGFSFDPGPEGVFMERGQRMKITGGAATGGMYLSTDCSDEEIRLNLELLARPVIAVPINSETVNRTLCSGPGLFCGSALRADLAGVFPVDLLDGLDNNGPSFFTERLNAGGGVPMQICSQALLFRRGLRVKIGSGTLRGAVYIKVLDSSQVVA